MPTIPEAIALAWLHFQNGDLSQATALYQQILNADPNNADAANGLGIMLATLGKQHEAIGCFEFAVQMQPSNASFHSNLGNVLSAVGRHQEAAASHWQALRLQPGHWETRKQLGHALLALGNLEEAIGCYRQAVGIHPNLPDAHCLLGFALFNDDQLDESIACFRRALELNPDHALALIRLAEALKELGKPEEVIRLMKRALQLQPNDATTHCQMGLFYEHEGQVDEAIACYSRALQLQPAHPVAPSAIAMASLLKGDFTRGWPAFESRFLLWPHLKRDFREPQWKGADCKGLTILLHAEGGLGDALQFVRYAPLVAARGCRVVLECQGPLRSLFARLPALAEVVVRGEPLPHFDMHSPLQSLPMVFGTTLDSVPAAVPYLQADASLTELWRKKLAEYGPGFKVGLVWAGGQRKMDGRRVTLMSFAPLAAVPGVLLFSLQKGDAALQAARRRRA